MTALNLLISNPSQSYILDSALSLRVNLCEDQNIIVNLDARTGKLVLRDTGDLAAAGRGPRFQTVADKLNEQPWVVPEAMVRLRYSVCICVFRKSVRY